MQRRDTGTVRGDVQHLQGLAACFVKGMSTESQSAGPFRAST